MPRKSDKIKLSPEQDRRRKLTDEQKEEILHRYKIGDGSQRSLAREYGVSRALIQIIVNPNIREAKRQRIKEHWRDYRPCKEEWAKIMKEHRQYKHNLYKEGKLK